MATSNEQLYDAFVRQQVNLQRMSKTEGEAMLRLLNESDSALDGFLQRQSGSFTMRRLASVQKKIQKIREPLAQLVGKRLEDLMVGTASQEMAKTLTILEGSVPIEVDFTAPAPAAVREAVMGTPFGDVKKKQVLGKWVSDLAVADENRIMGAIQAGIVRGSTVPELTQAVQQAIGVTRNQADALARTAVNAASNTARNAVFAENADVIQALRWTSVLDGRTSPVCRARDGQFRPADGQSWQGVPEPHMDSALESPPAHIRCRSLLTAVLDDESVAKQLNQHERITVKDTRTGKQRQIDFEKDVRKMPGWDTASKTQRATMRRQVRENWAKDNVKPVPGDTTYSQWLKRQDRDFVDEVMGPARAQLFMDGTLRMDQFVDKFGQPLTLEQLASLT